MSWLGDTVRSPRMARARRLQSASPRPTPGFVSAASLADLWNGRKRRLVSFGSTPGPSSQTWKMNDFWWLMILTSIWSP